MASNKVLGKSFRKQYQLQMSTIKVQSKPSRNQGWRRVVLSFVSLIIGLIAGFCTARLIEFEKLPNSDWILSFRNQNLQRNALYDRIGAEELARQLNPHTHALEDSSVAQKLNNEVRVLCWIMTSPKNHQRRALHIKRTWGQRCNKLIFISSKEEKELDTVALNVTEGPEYLWGKTREALKYIYKNHMEDADWFLKADDDTYVVLENLRYMLYPYAPETPIYFGCKFKPNVKQGYMSGGTGYVLSKEAVRRFVTKALPNKELCDDGDFGADDLEIGKCLESVQVIAGDSRDSKGREKFFSFEPEDHLNGKVDTSRYWSYVYCKSDVGMQCSSDYAVSFHYIQPDRMYVLDYLIYHLSPYGIVKRVEILPKKLTLEQILTLSNVSSKTYSTYSAESGYALPKPHA